MTMQSGVEVEHRVFKDMVEVDAHNAVYQAFNEAPQGVIRGKVDADVILNPNTLTLVANRISPRTWLDPMTHDHITDTDMHAGVAFYGDAVRFKHQSLTLKCDRDVAQNFVQSQVGVVGTHALFANEWMAFRYGFHRALKSQWPVYNAIKAAYDCNPSQVRLMAMKGYEAAQCELYDYSARGEPPPMDHNYGHPKLKELFDAAMNSVVAT